METKRTLQDLIDSFPPARRWGELFDEDKLKVCQDLSFDLENLRLQKEIALQGLDELEKEGCTCDLSCGWTCDIHKMKRGFLLRIENLLPISPEKKNV